MLHHRGRPALPVWKYYHSDTFACNYCGFSAHSKKAARAQEHLQKCSQFQARILSGTEEAPEFLNRPVVHPNSSSAEQSAPPLKKDEQKQFHQLMARGIYESGASLTILEQPSFKQAVQMLRPKATLPTRQAAASTILEATYAEKKEEILIDIQENNEIFTMQFDCAKGNDNYPYLHHGLTSPSKGYLLDVKNCKSESKNAEFLAAQFSRVYEALPNEIRGKVRGLVTDNCSTNISSWRLVQQKYPSIQPIGCACHVLHLLSQDITVDHVVGRTRTIPFKGQILEETFSVVNSIVTILKTERFNYDVNDLLKRNNKRLLCKPVTTRWGYCYYCVLFFYEALDLLFPFIHRLQEGAMNAAAKDYRKSLQNYFLDPDVFAKFKSNLELYITILKPIILSLKSVERSTSTLSDVIVNFNSIHKHFRELSCPQSVARNLFAELKSFLLLSVKQRLEFIAKPCHYFALILDPRYSFDDFREFLGSSVHTQKTNDFIKHYSGNDQVKVNRIKDQLINLREDKALIKDHEDIMYKAMVQPVNPLHPLKYWLEKKSIWPDLYEVAEVVLSLTGVTAYTERSFSIAKRTLRPERSSMKQETASKLCFMKVNCSIQKKRKFEEMQGNTDVQGEDEVRAEAEDENESLHDSDFEQLDEVEHSEVSSNP